ncbi:hypothetical protein CTAYLR_007252 [Chrysophaeum taylorii]|uniref:Uncharacterized protein n=1 Tax=Chrysophaeum taylorii TaxID=2483200 RepID=A0AAD7UB32_9STRA|nr:hypothetical protein CTAYLR_007252 [Chrysophaeum taylorii]
MNVEWSVGPVTAVAWFGGQDGGLYAARNGTVTTYASGVAVAEVRALPWRVHGLRGLDESSFLAWGRRRVVWWSKGRELWRGETPLRVLDAILVNNNNNNNNEVLAVDAVGSVCFGGGRACPALSAIDDVGELRCASLDADRRVAGGDAFGRLGIASLDGTNTTKNVLPTAAKPPPLHGGVVTAVRWSRDADVLASTSDDRCVRCWTADGDLKWCAAGHTARAWDVVFCGDDDDLVASCSQDARARLWLRETGECVAVLVAHAGKHAWCVAANGAALATGGADATVRLWEARRHRREVAGVVEMLLPSRATALRLVASTVLLVASATGELWRADIIDPFAGRKVPLPTTPTKGVEATWTRLVSACEHLAGATHVQPNGAVASVCGAPKGWVAVCRWRPDGAVLAAWRARPASRSLASWWLPGDGLGRLLVSTADRALTLWCLRDAPKPLTTISKLDGGATALAIDVALRPLDEASGGGALGSVVAVGDSRGRVSRLVERGGDVVEVLPRGPRVTSTGITAVAWTAANRIAPGLRCLVKDGRAVYMDANAEKRLAEVPIGHIAKVTRAVGDVAAGFVEDRHLVAVDVETGRRLASLVGAGHSKQPHDVHASPDGVALAAIDGRSLVYARAPASPGDLGPFLVADGVAAALWLSPTTIVCSGGSGQLACYVCAPPPATLARLRRLSPAVHAERAIAASHGVLVTASKYELRLWHGGDEPAPLATVALREAHQGEAEDQRVSAACAWHEDDDSLAVALGDSAGFVTLCDSLDVVARVHYDASPVLSLQRCRQRGTSILLAGAASGVVVLWRVEPSLREVVLFLALKPHAAGVNALVARSAASDTALVAVAGSDDHALSVLAFRFGDHPNATVEHIPRDSPTPVVGLAFGHDPDCVYSLATDLCLCLWRLADDAALLRRPIEWHLCASTADSISLTLLASIELDLGDARGLSLAPRHPQHADESPIRDRLLVFGDGGLTLVSYSPQSSRVRST